MTESQDVIKPQQANLEATLLGIALAKDNFGVPGRPIRNLVARCYVSLYSKAESRTLFDTVNTFLKFAGDAKVTDKDLVKTYAPYIWIFTSID